MSARRSRLRALFIVTGALAATALPTVAAFADPPPVPEAQPHSTPREEIQPAAHIVGELARKSAHRSTGRPLGLIPEQVIRHVALKAPQRSGPPQNAIAPAQVAEEWG